VARAAAAAEVVDHTEAWVVRTEEPGGAESSVVGVDRTAVVVDHTGVPVSGVDHTGALAVEVDHTGVLVSGVVVRTAGQACAEYAGVRRRVWAPQSGS